MANFEVGREEEERGVLSCFEGMGTYVFHTYINSWLLTTRKQENKKSKNNKMSYNAHLFCS